MDGNGIGPWMDGAGDLFAGASEHDEGWATSDLMSGTTPFKNETFEYFEQQVAASAQETAYPIDFGALPQAASHFSMLPIDDSADVLIPPLHSTAESADMHDDVAFRSAFAFAPNIKFDISPGTVPVVPHSPFEQSWSPSEQSTSPASTSTATPSDSVTEDESFGFSGSGQYYANFRNAPGEADDDDDDSGSDQSNPNSKSTFKDRHNASERKRQATINDAIGTLRSMLPVNLPSGKRVSKGAILNKSVEYMSFLIKANGRLKRENEQNKLEIAALQDQIASLRSGRPTTAQSMGSTVARTVTVMMGAMLFMMSMSAISFSYITPSTEVTSAPLGRALQSFSLSQFSMGQFDSVVVLGLAHVINIIMDFVVNIWLVGAYFSFIAVISLLLLQAMVPAPADGSSAMKSVGLISKSMVYAYRSSHLQDAEKWAVQGIELLGFQRLFESQNVLYLIYTIVSQGLKHLLLHMPLARFFCKSVIKFRRTTAYYDNTAMFLYMSNSLDAFNDTKSSSNCMRLRKIAAHLTALNACILGSGNDAVYAVVCMKLSNTFVQMRIPFMRRPLMSLSDALRRVSLMHSMRFTDTDNRSALARFFVSLGFRSFAEGNISESVLLLKQAADMRLATGYTNLWCFNLLMASSVYCSTGEMMGEADRLLMQVSNGGVDKDRRMMTMLDVSRQIVRFRSVEPTPENLREQLAEADKISWPEGGLPNLRTMHSTLRALIMARLGDFGGALELVESLQPPKDFLTLIPTQELVTFQFVTEVYLRLLEQKLRPAEGSQVLPANAPIEASLEKWMTDMAEFARTFKCARVCSLKHRAHYLMIKGDHVQAHAILQRAIDAAESIGWTHTVSTLRNEMQRFTENCKSAGVFLGSESNL